jgi:hypothetical protein
VKGNKKGDKRETTGGKLATARRKHFRKHGEPLGDRTGKPIPQNK